MAAVPQIGRATRVERPIAPGVNAAAELYERYSEQILGYCQHQLGSREEAEDAVQTTFMNALRGLQRGIVPELESAWLFKIAHNVCLSRHRSSWRRGKVESPNNFEVLQEVVAGPDHAADELIRLQDVLEGMPETQRRAILLREWQGLTYKEISTELGLTQGAVETLIFRARRALAQGLEQDADTWKRRLRRGADVGGVFACVKALLGGGGAAAVKVTATALAVATTAVAAATTEGPKHDAYHLSLGKQPAPTTIHVTRATAPRTAALTSTTLAHYTLTRTAKSTSSAAHRLSTPVTLPTSQAAEETHAPALAPSPAPTPTPEPAQTDPTPAPPAATIAAPAPTPERTPLATTQPAETTPAPASAPAPDPAPPADPPAEPEQGPSTDTGKPDKPDKPDKPEKPGKDK
ncbi:MAG TPA: RNA polymerase sigma factor [Gaiellaceae bacterium]|nr:RNA polymerase sigma factor [Gaiellaceae bacterium]